MSLQYRKIVSDALVAFLAQGISMLISAAVTILVPKVMGVEDFAYWQLFIFYTSYVGLFHLGLNDGVYLIHGGESRAKLNKPEIASELRFSISYQLIFAIIIALIGAFGVDNADRSFVIYFTAIFLLLNNLSNFLGFLFQAMNESKLYSYSMLVDRCMFLVPLAIFLVTRCDDFRYYIVAFAVSKLCCLLFCTYCARDILFQRNLPIRSTVSDSLQSIRVGIKLTLANISSMLIVGIARAIIDMNWGIAQFGQVSFALSLVTFFLTFVSQASLVLFPALRTADSDELKHFYQTINRFMSYTFPLAYLLYFPIAWVVTLWLPQYSDSMQYLALVMPICVFDTKMDICCTTYLKVLRMESQLLIINLCSVLLSTLGCLVCASLFHSLPGVLLAATAVVILRSVFSERLINSKLSVRPTPMSFFEVGITLVFAVTASFNHAWCFVSTLICIAIYMFAYRKTGMQLLASLRKIRSEEKH